MLDKFLDIAFAMAMFGAMGNAFFAFGFLFQGNWLMSGASTLGFIISLWLIKTIRPDI